ncbi:uncharacterized protein PFL1_04974 [Pseudozyma flocculosa PF-1]|uniref:MARVEL domain-containing protein n=2 Tax=Pseudozyma flocculosa TaxID=84751 RepID=A0A5C3EWJ2_9BASI|nr:uncharacterized protein PFL1_04974 [Pseudozyma flocculosa PF-1]EPQ27436.1 hypothetical protein PFL1_04974 [Pseudozyma flocculosa PF-1]SPO36135.1 uncharacterized protein PSFLO_01606 [Pseudozyma flocculosa]
MPDFMSIKSIVSKLKAEPAPNSRFGPGIGHAGGNAVVVEGDDRTFRVNLGLRGAQVFFALVAMLIAVYMAIFQSKWVGSPSGLTGLLLFVTAASLVASLIFLVVPFIYERSGFKNLKATYRALQEARVGIVTNATFTGLNLILALTQTISAYTSAGCKDATKDPHAQGDKKDDFIKEIPGWCRTKRAEAAFCWFLWIAWTFSLLIFLRQWRIERKQGPRIPPFTHPTDDSAFEPINDMDEDDEYTGYPQHAAGAPPLSSYDRRGSNPLANIEAKYGMNSAAAGAGRTSAAPPYAGGYSTGAPDPFADGYAASRPSYDYNQFADQHPSAYGVVDPYSAIQQQLQSSSHGHPPPPMPDLGFPGGYR